MTRIAIAPFAGTRVTLCAALVLAVAALAPPAARAEREGPLVTLSGNVRDVSGAPVPGSTVRVLKTRTVYSLKSHSYDQGAEENRTMSGADGAYKIDFPLDPAFRSYFVRFYDPKVFDAVKYRIPPDIDVTKKIREGGAIQADIVLQFQATWPEVKRLVEEYGPASPRGQIVRTLGLPSRRPAEAEGREIWVYEAAGVSYVVEGEKIVETHKIPVNAPPAEAPAIQPADAPTPAQRVDGS